MMPAQAQPRYGDLAKVALPLLYRENRALLQKIGEATLPHEAKPTRKRLSFLRAMLDVFTFAYPSTDFSRLRADIDEGYAVLGAYKDLFDHQGVPAGKAVYDSAELERAKAPVMRWLAGFFDRASQHDYDGLLERPSVDALAARTPKELRKSYWGGVRARPTADEPGYAALSHLVSAQLKWCGREIGTVRRAKDITRGKDRERFHRLRRRTRAAMKVLIVFPDLVPASCAKERTIIAEFVEHYGKLNDRLVAMDMAREARDKKEERRQRARARRTWNRAVAWQDNRGVRRARRKLRHDVVRPFLPAEGGEPSPEPASSGSEAPKAATPGRPSVRKASNPAIAPGPKNTLDSAALGAK